MLYHCKTLWFIIHPKRNHAWMFHTNSPYPENRTTESKADSWNPKSGNTSTGYVTWSQLFPNFSWFHRVSRLYFCSFAIVVVETDRVIFLFSLAIHISLFKWRGKPSGGPTNMPANALEWCQFHGYFMPLYFIFLLWYIFLCTQVLSSPTPFLWICDKIKNLHFCWRRFVNFFPYKSGH